MPNALTAGLRILALDPATVTGFAHVDMAGQVRSGSWNLGSKPGEHPGRRLAALRDEIRKMAEVYGIDRIAIEAASFGAMQRGGRVLVQVLQFHAEIRGCIKTLAFEMGLPAPIEYAPTTIKAFATGSGRASKGQMMRAHKLHHGDAPIDDNEADARAILEMARQGIPPHAKAAPKRRKAKVRPAAPKPRSLF